MAGIQYPTIDVVMLTPVNVVEPIDLLNPTVGELDVALLGELKPISDTLLLPKPTN